MNPDLVDIVTPVKVNLLREYLGKTNYDQKETEYLVNGFAEGFSLEYEGPWDRHDTARNLPFNEVGSHEELWSKMIKEVGLGRFAGPFNEIPFCNFVQSPVGLVPKANGQTRLIFHLSYDFKGSH